MIDFLQELHDSSGYLLSNVKFDKRNEQHRIIVSFYASMLEQTGSIIFMVRDLRAAGLPSIFRSLRECYVDLSNLINDYSYIKNLNAKYHSEWLKVMEVGADGKNPFLFGMANVQELGSAIQERKDKLQTLKNEGFHALSAADRFKRAGMEDVYRSLYNFQCSEAHNDIRALISRHFVVTGEDFEIAIYKASSLADFEAELDSAAGMLMNASLAVHKHFNSEVMDKLRLLDEKLAAVRKARDG